MQKGQGGGLVVIGRLADVIAEGQAQGRLLVVQPGGSTPGASSRSRSWPSRTQRKVRVTPARRALSTTFWRTSRLIRADLPTLGKPSIKARTGRGFIPRPLRR